MRDGWSSVLSEVKENCRRKVKMLAMLWYCSKELLCEGSGWIEGHIYCFLTCCSTVDDFGWMGFHGRSVSVRRQTPTLMWN